MAYEIKKGMTQEEIEAVLAAAGVGKPDPESPDRSRFAGVLKLDEPATEIQKRLRDGWERT